MTGGNIRKRHRNHYPQTQDFSEGTRLLDEARKFLDVQFQTVQDLELWLERWSELLMIAYELLAVVEIPFIRQADQEEPRRVRSEFHASLWTPFMEIVQSVNEKYYKTEIRTRLSAKRYACLDQILTNEFHLLPPENVTLRSKEAELIARLAQLDASLSVEFEGNQCTYYQLIPSLRHCDRAVREKAWRALYGSFLGQSEQINQIQDELIPIRVKQAINADFRDYRLFRHQELERFSFSLDNVLMFHETVEKEIIPLMKKLTDRKRERSGLSELRPWDSGQNGQEPKLTPCADTEDFLAKATRVLERLNPAYSTYLAAMRAHGLLDLENRKGKRPGASNTILMEQDSSHLSMHMTGIHNDVITFFHEFGHALHTRAMSAETIFPYHFPSIEVSELASKSMELLTMEFWPEFYPDEKDCDFARKKCLENALFSFRMPVLCDAFNHWVYANPDHTSSDRADRFAELQDRFNTGIDWTGLEKEKSIYWIASYHIVRSPFSEIGYCLAQLGALALYKQFTENRKETLLHFDRMLALGSSRSIVECYVAAGITFDFSPDAVRGIMDFLCQELKL